jgi:hypothetical protein
MTTSDRLRPAPFIAGFAGAVAVALTGVWLLVAPFAVGYQPEDAEWVDATIVGVATGGALVVLGLVLVLVIATALRDEVRRRGLGPNSQLEPLPTEPHDERGPDDGEDLAAGPTDLASVLAPLAAALLEDLRNGHEDRELDHLGDRAVTTPGHPSD